MEAHADAGGSEHAGEHPWCRHAGRVRQRQDVAAGLGEPLADLGDGTWSDVTFVGRPEGAREDTVDRRAGLVRQAADLGNVAD